jgi:hypothetical protein
MLLFNVAVLCVPASSPGWLTALVTGALFVSLFPCVEDTP